MEELTWNIIIGIGIVVIISLVYLFINNYMEQRQCDILESGNTNIEINFYFEIIKKCYIRLESDKLIDADNYRGFVE